MADPDDVITDSPQRSDRAASATSAFGLRGLKALQKAPPKAAPTDQLKSGDPTRKNPFGLHPGLIGVTQSHGFAALRVDMASLWRHPPKGGPPSPIGNTPEGPLPSIGPKGPLCIDRRKGGVLDTIPRQTASRSTTQCELKRPAKKRTHNAPTKAEA